MRFKNLFVVEDPPQAVTNPPVEEEPVEPDVPADTEVDNNYSQRSTTFVEDAYYKAGIDKNMLIYKVDDFIKTLPSEMPTATKKQTVYNIMNTVGLDKKDCADDAITRLNCLMEYGDSSISMLNNIIHNAKAEIEDHKLKIQELEKLCQDRSAEIDAINAAYTAEKNKIEELLNFLGVDEVADNTEES